MKHDVLFGVRRRVAAFKARTCPRTPKLTCRLALLLALFFLALPARADLMAVQTLEDLTDQSPAGVEQTTLYVSGNKVRYDKGQSLTSIILADRKVTFSIMHEPRQYIVLPHDRVAAAPPEQAPGEDPEEMAFEATGRKEKIGAFPCREVRVREKDGGMTELWLSEEALDMKTFLAEFRSFLAFGMAPLAREIDRHPELKGMPIRIVEYAGSRPVRRATITRLETAPLPPSTFEVPAGYAEVKMADFTPPEPDQK